MPTRLKRPSVVRALAVTTMLAGFLGYLGYSALHGQFGTESNVRMVAEIKDLETQSAMIQAEIDAYRHRVRLFDAERLDPDIVTERARALLGMAQADDVLVMLDPKTRLPRLPSPSDQDVAVSLVSGSSLSLSEIQLSPIPAERPVR